MCVGPWVPPPVLWLTITGCGIKGDKIWRIFCPQNGPTNVLREAAGFGINPFLVVPVNPRQEPGDGVDSP